jgi:hypothetical protein
MTARTQANVVALAADSGVAQGSANSAHSGGEYISGSSVDLRKITLVVVNGDSANHNVIVRATGNGNTVAGTAQTSPVPASTVFTQSTLGDLTVTVPAGTTQVVRPSTSDRYAQTDGNVYVDWSATTSMTYYVYAGYYNTV